ncbi:hypothetical protein P3S67_014778 [Capsicum chacoense]
MKDLDDVEIYRKSIERLRVNIFLAGLDDLFEQVHGDILRKESIPIREECYALIRREANQKITFKGESKTMETAAMIARNKQRGNRSTDKLAYKYTHCNESRHTKERCYELVGVSRLVRS